jgi:O-antigen ligase
MRPIPLSWVPFPEQVLLGFSLFSLLWRGGKGLEATWLLTGIAVFLTIANFLKGSEEAQQGAPRPAHYPIGLPLLAAGFFVWTMASFLHSSTANYGLDEVLRDGALVLVFFWTMERAMRGDAAIFVRRFASTISIGTVLAIAFGILVYAMQPVNRFVGTFFDYRFHTDYWPNAWAEYLLLAWPMMVLWIRTQRGVLRVTGYGILGIVFGALLLSYSRGAMIAFAGQVFLLGIWYALRKKNDAGAKLKVAGCKAVVKIGLIIFVAFAVFFSVNALRGQYHPVQSVAEKITFTADEGGSSVSERAQFWDQSMELIKQKPLYGWGPYSFRFIHQRLCGREGSAGSHSFCTASSQHFYSCCTVASCKLQVRCFATCNLQHFFSSHLRSRRSRPQSHRL